MQALKVRLPPPRAAQLRWLRVTPPISFLSMALKGLQRDGDHCALNLPNITLSQIHFMLLITSY